MTSMLKLGDVWLRTDAVAYVERGVGGGFRVVLRAAGTGGALDSLDIPEAEAGRLRAWLDQETMA